jgi:cullin-associated NEDD8-dissociated protein 1
VSPTSCRLWDCADHSAVLRLQACLPQFLSGTLKELSAKSAPTRQQAFVLLRQAADILQGGLETSADAICKAVTQSLKSVDTAATSSLAIAALSFLSTFFATHHPRVYGSHVESLVNAMTRCMKDKLHRISAEAFGAASSLAHTARPKGTSSPLAVAFTGPIEKLLQATTDVLGDTTVDTDIRERALETLGDLLVHEGDILTQSYPTALPLIKSRLANEASASTAMQVIGRIAEAPTCGGQVFEDWLLQVLPDVMVALRRSKRSAGKNTEFVCLQHVLARIASSLPVDTADALIIEMKAFIETPSALQAVALILEHQPECRHTVTEQVLPSIKSMLATPTNNPLLNDALAVFCGAYVRGDPKVATSLASELVANVKGGKALPDATVGGTSVSASTARCIGALVGAAPQSSSQVLHIFEKSIKVCFPLRIAGLLICSHRKLPRLIYTLLY